jgi:BirA family transcriptional regulator, biotin operon repressor / biotin---[acetyl-CoA-carboxylase] ligase
MSAPDLADRLLGDRLQSGIAGSIIGRRVMVLEETTSTNDQIRRFAKTGAKQGLVVFAEHQTAGRGQRGNRWESTARKGLWFSILLHPKIEVAESSKLTAWAAETVAATIQSEFRLVPRIKFPNDIYIDGKKLAGVLVEMRARKKAEHLAIAGIGINVNQSAQDFSENLRPRAVSLAMAVGRPIDREKFAVALLANLDRTYRGRFAP